MLLLRVLSGLLRVLSWLVLLLFFVSPLLYGSAGIDIERLVYATCAIETRGYDSAIREYIVSSKGAVGRCQIMPATARYLADKYKVRGFINEQQLTELEYSLLFATLRYVECIRQFKVKSIPATLGRLPWCYMSGRKWRWPPKDGWYGKYTKDVLREYRRVGVILVMNRRLTYGSG